MIEDSRPHSHDSVGDSAFAAYYALSGHALVPPPGRANLLDDEGSSRQRPERADAARNRARVLQAAERLFATADPRTVTMDDIARAAGVGRATLYRRYPDPGAIAVALLDEHERALQEKLIFGGPPLGPGAHPADRLAAFYAAMIDLLDRHLHLALGVEVGSPRMATGAYRFWRTHVHALVRAAGAGDPDTLTDILMAPLAPEVYRFQRDEIGLSIVRITDALGMLARRVLLPG
ncbi:MAG TPA: helix-turn-helix domain-containing protein [Streptosporangiaceae bacterium]|nr:helix-turn-helix domain-containing protein [Streptosporangiaceae bacterium]